MSTNNARRWDWDVLEQNIDSMYQECKHTVQRLKDQNLNDNDYRNENENLRQQIRDLQAMIDVKDSGIAEAHGRIEMLEADNLDLNQRIKAIEETFIPHSGGVSAGTKRPRVSSPESTGPLYDTPSYSAPFPPQQRHIFRTPYSDAAPTTPSQPTYQPNYRRAQSYAPDLRPASFTNGPGNTPYTLAYARPHGNPSIKDDDGYASDNGGYRSDGSDEPATRVNMHNNSTAAPRPKPRYQRFGKVVCHNCWKHRYACHTRRGEVSCDWCKETKTWCTREVCAQWQREGRCSKGVKCHGVHDNTRGYNLGKEQLQGAYRGPR
ncbi:uncharacterized protein BDZ99DRAFT_552662 [Mytilinidion resinicola]|uniref:C3H1-type domain-containing protein n=1 Tax=Mytilinidion resinicola TaxID=574789 RepID=A0A6A6XZ53_9PEZI|nr:uncharacterized protein BDZ99DRAFT_552662 [Mytilinidion resinicola]KAF2801669.1 hypothetical protein BDZ99DRAFT_552662 [Mytilinidion resinicola]